MTVADLPRPGADAVRLFLSGDVMTGRGIDQILPHPGDPRLYEPYMQSARGYVALAEAASGAIPRRVAFDYVWGDALDVLGAARPALRIVNLETAVTVAPEAWPGKGIHYRMHPANVPCLTAAAIDCCVLANNHTLDWGYGGLAETIDTLRGAAIQTVGAGADARAAAAPAILDAGNNARVLVFAYALASSGVPVNWAAHAHRAGVNLLPNLADDALETIARAVRAVRRAGDVTVISLHWGGNWGYAIPASMRRFAHALVDLAVADVVHGHSSHHPLGIEVHRGHLVLYGCGDLLNDYEGIEGHEHYRPDLALLYLPEIERTSGRLRRLDLAPVRIRRFRLEHATAEDAAWLATRLTRDGNEFGSIVSAGTEGWLALRWT